MNGQETLQFHHTKSNKISNAITETKLRYVVDDYQNTHMTKVKQSHVPMRNVDGRVLVRKDPYAEGW